MREKRDHASAREADLFLNEVSDATPLRDRDRAPAERASARPARATNPSAHHFAVERDGDRVEGRAHGVSRRQLSELRAGRVRPEATADLHGLDAEAARHKLSRFLDESTRARRRCVLVIHGRGLHSDDDPVLKDRVLEWLTRSRAPIRGFCTARPSDGGAGALYIQLEGE